MDFGSQTVVVPRRLLSEILEDGICPLHLRIQIQRLLSAPPGNSNEPRFVSRSQRLRAELRSASSSPESPGTELPEVVVSGAFHDGLQEAPAPEPAEPAEPAQLQPGVTAPEAEVTVLMPAVGAIPAMEGTDGPPELEASDLLEMDDAKKDLDLPAPSPEELAEARRLDQEERLQKQKLQLDTYEFRELLSAPCLVLVVCGLPLEEILALRAVNSSALQWAMDSGIAHLGEVCQAHHRIRTRLWIQRLEEINRHTTDESLYDSKVRRLADEALRRRMEAEMADARQDMENRIRDFHVEVDRRMEAQAVRVHAIVEERVQQQLDTILAAEMEKVRVLVEERVQGRVRQVVQREVYATVCEMQAKLATLAKENEKLRAVFLEHLEHSDLCFRSLVWALSPNSTGLFARTLRLIWCCRRRFTRFSAWMLGVPGDSRRDILRQRLELIHYLGFAESVMKVVNLLGDADTTGAICGQLAGALYGWQGLAGDGWGRVRLNELQRWDPYAEIGIRAALLYHYGPLQVLQVELQQKEGHPTVRVFDRAVEEAVAQRKTVGQISSGSRVWQLARERDFAKVIGYDAQGKVTCGWVGIKNVVRIADQPLESARFEDNAGSTFESEELPMTPAYPSRTVRPPDVERRTVRAGSTHRSLSAEALPLGIRGRGL